AELNAIAANIADTDEFTYTLVDDETMEETDETGTGADLKSAIAAFEKYEGGVDPANYGTWVPGVPVLIEKLLGDNCPDWLHGLIIDGIVGGVGAVLGFVPQMLVLFLLLA
ncbi:MAG TPA: ferrous iron transporter B, partial [Ruminococcus sp.]|nr:ferrous iron transporter B [Ruminococcus sp.]